MDDDARRPDPDLPELRASDAERHATARVLQQAFSEGRLTLVEFDERTEAAYAARFHRELDGLTSDLVPAHRPTEQSPAVRHQSVHHQSSQLLSPRVTGGKGPSVSLAVMGGVERRGHWTLTATHTVVSLMGGIELDLRDASLESGETTIWTFAIMGGIDILVPDDVAVEVEGFGLMGGFGEESGPWKKDPRPVRQAPPGAPRIRVKGLALMGGISVRRVPRPEA